MPAVRPRRSRRASPDRRRRGPRAPEGPEGRLVPAGGALALQQFRLRPARPHRREGLGPVLSHVPARAHLHPAQDEQHRGLRPGPDERRRPRFRLHEGGWPVALHRPEPDLGDPRGRRRLFLPLRSHAVGRGAAPASPARRGGHEAGPDPGARSRQGRRPDRTASRPTTASAGSSTPGRAIPGCGITGKRSDSGRPSSASRPTASR